MSRIAGRFAALKAAGRKALIPYVTAGDPLPASTVPILHALVEAGADILEIGVPFSDPMADGPAIQRSSERALKNGIGLSDVLNFVIEFRKEDSETPVVLMGYANPIEAMGVEKFVVAAKASGLVALRFGQPAVELLLRRAVGTSPGQAVQHVEADIVPRLFVFPPRVA